MSDTRPISRNRLEPGAEAPSFLDYAPDDVIRPADVPLVSIITYCQHPAMLYGTLLTFKTLRVGFPTAEVEVWDNGSLPELVAEIRAAAEATGARKTTVHAAPRPAQAAP